MTRVILEEKNINEIQSLINQLPISHLPQAQRIVAIMNECVEQPKEVTNEKSKSSTNSN